MSSLKLALSRHVKLVTQLLIVHLSQMGFRMKIISTCILYLPTQGCVPARMEKIMDIAPCFLKWVTRNLISPLLRLMFDFWWLINKEGFLFVPHIIFWHILHWIKYMMSTLLLVNFVGSLSVSLWLECILWLVWSVFSIACWDLTYFGVLSKLVGLLNTV